jgi:hypothetical protein
MCFNFNGLHINENKLYNLESDKLQFYHLLPDGFKMTYPYVSGTSFHNSLNLWLVMKLADVF